jgi:hypothetical protein
MKWPDTDISFGQEDHPKIELSNQILPFMAKLPIRRHKVAKAMIDNGPSLNLIMRKIFIEMCLAHSDLTPIHDTFHVTCHTLILKRLNQSPHTCAHDVQITHMANN